MDAAADSSIKGVPAVTSLLEVNGLSKKYGALEAVRDITFAVTPGEIFGLLGLNGAGKTTTLECILGLRRPDAGTISLDGVDISRRPTEARRRVGAQLQADALQDKITPRQALDLFASFYRRAPKTESLLNRFGLSEKADEPFDSLSGGQKQRLFLALAFVPEAPLLVLDEPTAGLDPALRRELHLEVEAERAAGRGILLSTHDLHEAEVLCDRVGILHRGRLVAVGNPRAFVSRARAKVRARLRITQPILSHELRACAGLENLAEKNGEWTFETENANAALAELLPLLTKRGSEVLDFRIQGATLEDVFLELTGERWSEPKPQQEVAK